jgi:hypothetical protein
VTAIVWRRLDCAGTDSAQLAQLSDGWSVNGVAAFTPATEPCRLSYAIECDNHWRTRRCTVAGFIGSRSIGVNIMRNEDATWTIDGASVASVDGCDDVDLAFTPATNLLPIRRLALDIGVSARVRAAWLRFPEFTMEPLDQVYTRIAPERYRYSSADGTFQRDLAVDPVGFVRDYPGLWIAED